MNHFSANTTRTARGVKSLLVFLCALLSLGAWWNFEKTTKRDQGAENIQQPSQTQLIVSKGQDEPERLADADSAKVGEARSNVTLTPRPPQETREIQNKKRVEVKKKTVQGELYESPKRQQEEVEKTKAELEEIIGRTRQLQERVQDNRSEIQKILERAQIHERILKSISIPQSIPTKYQINTDEIVKQEKLRLIAEQARQTQEQLRIIQQTKSLGRLARSAPTKTKVSNAS